MISDIRFRLSLLLLAMVLSACSTAPSAGGTSWPMVDTLPTGPPEDLNTSAPATVLRFGSDGFAYIVGGIPDTVRVGDTFIGRYSGDWPLEDLPRPPLTTGRVVKVFNEKTALVSLSYIMPNAKTEGLEVTWESEPLGEPIGKGIGYVTDTNPGGRADVQFNLGAEAGVEIGDIYAILRAPESDSSPDVQVSRRVTTVCLVNDVIEDAATCRLWKPSGLLDPPVPVEVGQRMLFLEHTFGRAPPTGVIQIASVEGDIDGAGRAALANVFSLYTASLTSPKANIELLEQTFDATRVDFHQIEGSVVRLNRPHVVVAGSVREVKGKKHLIVNYTGIGSPIGPRIVAAPPEGGVDMGPLDDLSSDRLLSFAGTVWSAMLVFRGQTSEALVHIKSFLDDKRLSGPLRWHLRDQFAMRWVALGDIRQAKWLVEEDLAVARATNDRDAYLNALGTVIHLHDQLEMPERALASAKEYLDARAAEKPSSTYISAQSMYIQMLLGAERVEKAKTEIEALIKTCPEGCDGQLASALGGIAWSIPKTEQATIDLVVDTIVGHAKKDGEAAMATARFLQGVVAMRGEEFEQALIAFLESGRLYESHGDRLGQSRAKYLEMLAQMRRNEPDSALKAGFTALMMAEEFQDYRDVSDIYLQLTRLYTPREEMKTGPYLTAALEIFTQNIQCRLATGDEAGAAESLHALGSFLLRVQKPAEAKVTFQRAVYYSIRTARFDVTAMSHLSLAVVARLENNLEEFRDEIRRAKLMAEISGDEAIQRAIEEALKPPEEPAPDPTQLL